jgi:hypothetical protein
VTVYVVCGKYSRAFRTAFSTIEKAERYADKIKKMFVGYADYEQEPLDVEEVVIDECEEVKSGN